MSRKKRRKPPGIPWYYLFIPKLFPLAEALFPKAAGKFALNLFTTPLKIPPTKKEVAFIQTAVDKGAYEFEGEQIPYYVWGKGVPVVALHGWNSRPSHLRVIIKALVDNGFQVYGLFAPGHGESKKKNSNLIEFAKGLNAFLNQKQLEPYAFLGHSLGGAAAIFNVVEFKLKVSKLVTLATPSIGQSILDVFKHKINGGKAVDETIRNFGKGVYNKEFDEVCASEMAKHLPPEIGYLIVHDENDREAPLENAHAIKKAFPKAELMLTQGEGHNRILKNTQVALRVVDFLISGKG